MSTPSPVTPMTKSGFCQWPSEGSHAYCQRQGLRCDCACHTDPTAFDDGKAASPKVP